MTQKTLKIAFIGASGHFMAAVDAMRKDPALQPVGCCAGVKGEDLSDIKGVLSCPEYPDCSTLLERERPDIAVVGTHFSENAGICAALLRRGISCYSEKPAATDARGLAALEEALQHTGAYYTNMLEMRAFPHFLAMRGAVEQGLIGEIRLVHVQKSYRLGVRPSFYTRRESYGGTIPWVGAHAFDLIQWICSARLHPCFARHGGTGGAAGEMERSALCAFSMEGGGFASASLDFLRPEGAPTHADDRMRIAGSRGVLETVSGRVTLLDEQGSRALALPRAENPFAHFVNLVRTGERSPVTPSAEESVALARLCLSLRDMADAAGDGPAGTEDARTAVW